ncbi:MAG: alanine--glyoxylate aminotransferase family protein [Candidatus Nezhaarchaeales archaeon]
MTPLLMLPGPTNVPERVLKALSRPVINHRGPEFRELYRSIFEGLRYVFQTEGYVFPLTCSGTGGVECAIFNLMDDGDKAIVAVNGEFARRMGEAVKAAGGQLVEIPIDWGKPVKAELVKEAVEREKNVKLVGVVYNETSTGVTSRELESIAKVAAEANALMVVDAISILGGEQLPVDKWGIDICITGSQKCLACPPGLSMISVSDKAWEALKRRKRPKTFYFDLLAYKRFHDERYETPYTPAVPLLFALDEALKMVREEGLEERFKRHARCARGLYAAAEALGLEALAEANARSNTVIAIKNPPGISDRDVIKVMREEHNVHIAGGMGKLRGSTFRIGSMGIVSEQDIIRTVEALEKTLLKLGYKLELGTGVEAARKAMK